MKILSIDPGVHGQMCLIVGGTPTEFMEIPSQQTGSAGKRRVDFIKLKHILDVLVPDVVVIEKVGPGPKMGASAAFGFGANSVGLEALCIGMGLRSHTIQPQRWKSAFGLLGTEKDQSRINAIKEFPQLRDELKRKKDVDRADSMWIGLAWLKYSDRSESC